MMKRTLLVCLSLGRCTTTAFTRTHLTVRQPRRLDFCGEGRVSAAAKSQPCLTVRGGDGGSSAILTATALKSSVLSAVDTFYKTMPLASAFITCGVKASLADAVAQQKAANDVAQASAYSENDDAFIDGEAESVAFEKRRNFAFLLYGGLYQGMAQAIIFNDVFPILFGSGTGWQTVLSKVLCDSLVVTPFLCLPVAYVVKRYELSVSDFVVVLLISSITFNNNLQRHLNLFFCQHHLSLLTACHIMQTSVIFQYSFQEAIRRYKDDVLNNGLLVKYWSLWGPVQCLTFSVVPEHLRIVWIALVSFFWLIIFSSIAAKGQKERELLDDHSCTLEDGVSCRIDG